MAFASGSTISERLSAFDTVSSLALTEPALTEPAPTEPAPTEPALTEPNE